VLKGVTLSGAMARVPMTAAFQAAGGLHESVIGTDPHPVGVPDGSWCGLGTVLCVSTSRGRDEQQCKDGCCCRREYHPEEAATDGSD
jgi:hypothetical protein